jgi:uncharacterized protein YecA (UPF0149 family)
MRAIDGKITMIEDEESLKKLKTEEKGHVLPLTDRQVVQMKNRNNKARKNWMRNQKCPCNSGKKYKKCCWGKDSIKTYKTNEEFISNV